MEEIGHYLNNSTAETQTDQFDSNVSLATRLFPYGPPFRQRLKMDYKIFSKMQRCRTFSKQGTKITITILGNNASKNSYETLSFINNAENGFKR